MASDSDLGSEAAGPQDNFGHQLEDFFRATPEPEASSQGGATEPIIQLAGPDEVPRPTWRDRRVAGRLRARKVRRLIRHIEPWSVLKIALLFNFCLWVIFMIAGVLMWNFAEQSATLDNIEKFIKELFALEEFQFDGNKIFEASAIGGLVMVVAFTGFAVLMAVLFNLISDLTGGLRATVIEEETARVFVPAGEAAGALEAPVDPALGPGSEAVVEHTAIE
ncbi:MAG: DUF3566 domain-containing protein [Acidimicrobiia bacterium]|nr:DUF3566 domain-containing protein [Acidimicrobiia bacterium]